MSRTRKNGCLALNKEYLPGTWVKAMPRAQALIVSRKMGLPAPNYTVSTETAVSNAGFRARIREVYTRNPDGSPKAYVVNITGATAYVLSAEAIFGPDYAPCAVVEVGTSMEPDRPPVRRLFVSYGFDHEFNPVVVTYDEEDTASILDDMNTADVNLECGEMYDYVFPVASQVKNTAPVYDVSVARNGRSIKVKDLSRAEWCEIYDKA